MSVSIDMAYEGTLHCRAAHGPSRQVIVTDAPVDNGGKGESFSPTDLVATALGSCVLTIMGIVAAQHDLDIDGTRAEVVKDMVADPVRRIGSLAVSVTLPSGLAISDADKARLENAAYACPVKQSLHPDVAVRITFTYPA